MATSTIYCKGKVVRREDKDSKTLWLGYLGIESISDLKIPHMPNLKKIRLEGNYLHDLKGIEKYPWIQGLDLSKNPLENMEGLDNLKLEYLEFWADHIPGRIVSFVSRQTKLRKLIMHEVRVVPNLEGCKRLRKLCLGYYICSSAMKNIHKLPTSLEGLTIGGRTITSLASLSRLKNLQELFICRTGISSLKGLYLPKLKSLLINDCPNLKKLDFWNMPNLEVIVVDDCPITRIEGLGVKSRDISISSSKLKDLSCFKECENLKRLAVTDGKVTSIKDILSLKNLKGLYLGQNKISSLEGISNLKNLRYLYVWKNRLSEADEIASLNKLKELNIAGNKVHYIEVDLPKGCTRYDI